MEDSGLPSHPSSCCQSQHHRQYRAREARGVDAMFDSREAKAQHGNRTRDRQIPNKTFEIAACYLIVIFKNKIPCGSRTTRLKLSCIAVTKAQHGDQMKVCWAVTMRGRSRNTMQSPLWLRVWLFHQPIQHKYSTVWFPK